MAKIESTGPLTATLDGGAGRKPTFEIAGEGIIEFETTAEMDAAVKLRSPEDPNVLFDSLELTKGEQLGPQVLEALYRRLKRQNNFDETQRADIFTRAIAVVVLLKWGLLREAAVQAANTPTGGSFTAGVRTILVNAINAAISQL